LQTAQALQPPHLHFADHGVFRYSPPVHQFLQAAVVAVEVHVVMVVVLPPMVQVVEVVSVVLVAFVSKAAAVVMVSVDASLFLVVERADFSLIVIVVVDVSVVGLLAVVVAGDGARHAV